MTTCRGCGGEFPDNWYPTWPSGSLNAICDSCKSSENRHKSKRHYRQTPHLSEKRAKGNRGVKLRLKYGMSLDDYQNMIDSQGGRCAICRGSKLVAGRANLHVDHCHKSGKVRGILCHNCNAILGQMSDSVDGLMGLARYARKNLSSLESY